MSADRSREDVFSAARQVAVADTPGLPALRRQGGRLVGPCPVCGGSAGSTRFQIDPRQNRWCCFACPPGPGQRVAGGGPIEMERHLRGGTAMDAATRLAGMPAERRQRQRPERRAETGPRRAPPRRSYDLVRDIWRGCGPAARTIVEAWLQARGCDPAALPGGLAALRFHPHCPAAWRGGRATLHAPAMVAPVLRAAAGASDWIVWRIAGLHVTYLTPDGRAKARLRHPGGDPVPARKVYGRLLGGVVALSDPARLGDAAAGPLVVSEGIETTWSLAEARIRTDAPPGRVAAVLSLANLQGGMRRDRHGCIDPAAPVADPDAPPWRLPDAGAVVIGVDSDMAPMRMRVRGPDGRPAERALGALDRAALCASLARQHWRAAGAAPIEVLRPPAGKDFNDLAREAVA